MKYHTMTCKMRGEGLENCVEDEVARGGWGMVALPFQVFTT